MQEKIPTEIQPTNRRSGPIIFGIDPGTRLAGFAVLAAKKPQPLLAKDFYILDAGVIRFSPKESAIRRLGLLHETIFSLLSSHQPDHCVIEKAFYGLNAQSALRLGEARGVCISALHRAGVTLHEMSPNHMKKSITGRGHATKEEVAFVVKQLLQFDRQELPFDVTDALALALSLGLRLNSLAAYTGSTGFSSQLSL